MAQTNLTTPDYERPPVNEVVAGITFTPPDGFLTPHVGLFWSRLLDRYPNTQEAPTLLPILEADGQNPVPSEVEISDTPPLPRSWFIDDSGTRLVQIQRDRLLHNWRKLQEADEYPHYDSVIATFRGLWEEYQAFLSDLELGSVSPTQYELTYVNQVFQGDEWAQLADVGDVFPDVSWRAGERFLPEPELVSWRTAFPLPDGCGRLHALMRTGRRRDTGHALLGLELTARGFPSPESEKGMWSWFDLAHEWIVRGFADLTSERVQTEMWRRIR